MHFIQFQGQVIEKDIFSKEKYWWPEELNFMKLFLYYFKSIF